LLGHVIGIWGKKIYRWYKESLSGFREDSVQRELHAYDTEDRNIIDKLTKQTKKILVPIFRPDHFGKNMCMDDKNVGGVGYLIFSNVDTKKVALMLATTKLSIVKEVLYKVSSQIRFRVDTMSRDMAYWYHWFVREMFPNIGQQIADKFHVIKHALDALQDIRIRYRQEELRKRRSAYEAHKQEEKERRIKSKTQHKKYVPRKFEYKVKMFENGDSVLELLAKWRYLLFKFESEWKDEQEERAKILFREYPEIMEAHKLICSFRSFYSVKVWNVKKAEKSLEKWFRKVKVADIEEVSNFASMVERNKREILNYFYEWRTNAFAEWLNSQIEKFIQTNIGVKDRDFFHFRLKQFFT